MKNEYMFFNEETFTGVDIEEYIKTDILIPETSIYIYVFECENKAEEKLCQAKKLNELTLRLESHCYNKFKVICSGSSQYLCNEIYPLIVKFETLLRKTLYISRVLFNHGEINMESFTYMDEKKEKSIEELELGKIYESVFTDKNLKSSLLKEYNYPLTKADLIKRIQALPEETEWQRMVGKEYDFIESNFMRIKDIRNSIMHNHLINYSQYEESKTLIEKANEELENAITNKLLTNKSEYLNTVNIVDVISGIIKFVACFAEILGKVALSPITHKMIEGIGYISENQEQHLLLENMQEYAQTQEETTNDK